MKKTMRHSKSNYSIGLIPEYQRNKIKNFFSRPILYITIGLILIIFVPVIAGIIDDNWPRNYYQKGIYVCNAVVAEKDTEEGKYYLRLNIDGNELNSSPNPDDLWIEVKPDFYDKYNFNSSVGALVSYYDIYKKRVFSPGQDFENSAYGIEEVYDSIGDAQQANPYKKYTDSAVINKKKIKNTGEMFFTLKNEDRLFNIEVSKVVFDKYSVNQEVQCEFESFGESVKLLRVVE